MNGSLIHRTLNGKKCSEIPFWFMRQAGRYLPEYREVRAKAGGFLNLCYTPELAAEVTLQPVRRFDVSAAIIFSDILVIPHAMGVDVRFETGEGPRLSVTRDIASIQKLQCDLNRLNPVSDALKVTRRELSKDKSLIGFCGAPWTVACYMVEGGSSRDYEGVRLFALSEEKAFSLLIDKIVESSVNYLSMQVKSGADIIQIFDSWAGVLSENEFEKWVIMPTKKIVTQLKSLHPEVPVIGFPRGAGVKYKNYAENTGIDAVSVDVMTPMAWAKDTLHKTLQGNLDPILLMKDKQEVVKETRAIINLMKDKSFIFNLGHGVLQHTPIENIEAVCEEIKK